MAATPQQKLEWEAALRDRHGPGVARLQEALDREARDVALLRQRIERAPPAPVPAPPVSAMRR
jgi:hypothetical protein